MQRVGARRQDRAGVVWAVLFPNGGLCWSARGGPHRFPAVGAGAGMAGWLPTWLITTAALFEKKLVRSTGGRVEGLPLHVTTDAQHTAHSTRRKTHRNSTGGANAVVDGGWGRLHLSPA